MQSSGKTARTRAGWVPLTLATAVVLGGATSAYAIVTSLGLVGDLHEPQGVHFDQFTALDLVQSGQGQAAFEGAFAEGDELFETQFNALDGVGANVGDGQRFTRVPRADLDGGNQWANHTPARATGPNAQACNQCHIIPFDDGAGTPAMNVHRDPGQTASLGAFIQRNTPHLFGIGALQRLAEEMTEDLHAIRAAVADQACRTGRPKTRSLDAKGVSYGAITAVPVSQEPCEAEFDVSAVEGVNGDLVVKPLQWKGSTATVRDFNRGAAHNEIGMQAVEIAGDGVDGDFDGVADEMTVGDMTAMAIYVAAQPRPTTRQELASFGIIPPLTAEENAAIARGGRVFAQVGCADCHRPALKIDVPVFAEPSGNENFRDAVFPAGQDPVARGVDPEFPVAFDLTQDHPDNHIEDEFGNLVFNLGTFRTDNRGRAVVELYGDLKRHDMGPGLAESIDEVGTGASVWLTKELWGVGSTAPYLHDGRATTLTEAILEHGGEAAGSRDAFERLPLGDQAALIAFLDNLVLFKAEEE
ncbi:MAG: hypothetical protein OEM93_04480 [Rhodospirillales bacterium]|nr:hypothetical protein [Rhodospirillales bacterium]MDH3967765.1 hypothetical protein [Rhodospirillales bacterium]